MTIEEKRTAIESYCNSKADCLSCIMMRKPSPGNCYTKSDDPEQDADIEGNYEFLFGEEPTTKEPTTRSGILETAAKIITGHRTEEYGSPEDNFTTIALLWDTYISANCVKNGQITITAQDAAAMLILLKVGRLGSGKGSMDCWVDIAGYAACGGEIASKG